MRATARTPAAKISGAPTAVPTAADATGQPSSQSDSRSQFIDFHTPRIEAGEHGGDAERISMAVASLEHVVHTARDSGVDPGLPAAVLAAFRRAADAGHAEDSLTRRGEVLGRPQGSSQAGGIGSPSTGLGGNESSLEG
ncbi:hypothetical protein [Streptomyces sp. NPDC060194]|uniref:imine reductase family protein n=1 Tax=Streptomyces sp. NPDC060194 TaxID=3347069 RepID=UPI00364EAD0E